MSSSQPCKLILLTMNRYQSELCDRKYRGRLVSAETLFVGVGIVFAYWYLASALSNEFMNAD